MRFRPFGNTLQPVAVLGQGTWQAEVGEAREAIGAIRRGIDLGMRLIDTAALYGDGAAEALVGQALQGRRQQVFLVSKLDPMLAHGPAALRACEATLRRLGTDHLDCYLLHWLGPRPLEDTVEAFETLVRQGKIRSWGVSNFDEVKLAELAAVAGSERIACNQVMYHLQQRSIEHALLPYCQHHDIAVVAYSPLGAGRFVDPHSASGRRLAELAANLGASPRQLALAYLLRHPHIFAVPKACRLEHVEENARAADLALDAATCAALDRLFPSGPPRPGVPLPSDA